jgi:hypothetical protein
LDDELWIQIWLDDGDNIFEPGIGEVSLLEGMVSDVLSDSSATGVIADHVMAAGAIQDIGFQWRVVTGEPGDPCTHSPYDINKIQGDCVMFDITFTLNQMVGASHASIGNKVHDPDATAGDVVVITCDVENIIDAAPGVSLTVTTSLEVVDQATGGVDYSHTDSQVTIVAPGTTEPSAFDWTAPAGPPDTVATYEVTITSPDAPEVLGPQTIVVTTPPVSLQVGTEWVYNVHYDSGTTYPPPSGGWIDDTVRTCTIQTTNEVVPDQVTMPGDIVQAPAVLSHRIQEDWISGGATPVRYTTTGVQSWIHANADWESVAEATWQYWYMTGDAMAPGMPLEIEFSYTDYALVGGSNIGQYNPWETTADYAVGDSWTYTRHQQVTVAGASANITHMNFRQTVTAAGVGAGGSMAAMVVPAGTFDDYYEIVTYLDVANIGAPTQPSPPNPPSWVPVRFTYWSCSVRNAILITDTGNFAGTETQELASYSLVWG